MYKVKTKFLLELFLVLLKVFYNDCPCACQLNRCNFKKIVFRFDAISKKEIRKQI